MTGRFVIGSNKIRKSAQYLLYLKNTRLFIQFLMTLCNPIPRFNKWGKVNHFARLRKMVLGILA
jgi:hypothetical protein